MIILVYIINFQYDKACKEWCQMYKVMFVQQTHSSVLNHEALPVQHMHASKHCYRLRTLTVGGVKISFLTKKNTKPLLYTTCIVSSRDKTQRKTKVSPG